MTPQVPKTMRAYVQTETPTKAAIKEVDVPSLEPNEVLIEVAYAGLNPTDAKHLTGKLSPEGSTFGCDLSGTIVALGSDVKNADLQVGTKVAAVVHGGKFHHKGSFADYAKADSELVWPVPEGLELRDAAAMSMGFITNGLLLFQSMGQDLPPAKVSGEPWLLVYGGSTGMGFFAIQLGKAAGYKVIAVQSEHNFDLVKSFGADAVVDYKRGDAAIEEIKKITGGGVHTGVDLVSLEDSISFALKCFKEGGDNKLRLTLPAPDSTKSLRADVDMVNVLMYTAYGRAFQFMPGVDLPEHPEHREFFEELCKVTPQLIKDFNIRAPPIDERKGLEAIEEAYEEILNGKVSGKKIVFKIKS